MPPAYPRRRTRCSTWSVRGEPADRSGGAEPERRDEHDREPREDGHGMVPVLAGDRRREQHRNGGLQRERAGGYPGGALALERGHLAEQRDARYRRGRDRPRERGLGDQRRPEP